jgi:hypothetical protein
MPTKVPRQRDPKKKGKSVLEKRAAKKAKKSKGGASALHQP